MKTKQFAPSHTGRGGESPQRIQPILREGVETGANCDLGRSGGYLTQEELWSVDEALLTVLGLD
jgi:hypothetical protein